jgi:hypothetical protein
MNCTACHGEQGVSRSGLYPTLAGMDAAAIYKQLDDFRAGKRSWGAIKAIAQALSAQASADVAAYFASRPNGLTPVLGERSWAGHAPLEHEAAMRLVFAGDPSRHSAVRRLSRPWRQQAWRTAVEGAAGRLYRTPARGLRPKHAAE